MITEALPSPDIFVPLLPALTVAKDPAFSALNVKVLTQSSSKPISESMFTAPEAKLSHSPEVCAKPSVTLQRTGDVVIGIRVQCGCGQVIELNCLY